MAPSSGRSFAASVKKAYIDLVVQKQLSVSFSDMPLRHNQWSKGKSLHLERFADGEHTICFGNMLSQIRVGIQDDSRIGEQIYVSKMKCCLYFTANADLPALSYRIIVYMTPNSLPTSTGEPTLRHENSDQQFGFNHLLRSVDPRSNHVLYEKLISPNQMGGLTGVSTSYIEQLSVNINKTITY